ncbi:MAG: ATP-binding protein [Thermoplasmatota archaeon]
MATKAAFIGHDISAPHPAGGQGVAPSPTDAAAIAARDYHRLFEANPTPLIVVDHAGLRIVAANPAASRALGYSEPEFLASAFADFVSPSDRDALLRLAEPAPVPGLLEARSSWNVRRRDGTPVRLEVAGAALEFAGHPCAVLFQPAGHEPSAQDVGSSGASLPEFSFSALHDLKEPLHLIKGYLSLLRSHGGSSLDDESREFLESAFDGTQRMQAIVLNLLEFFRVDARGIAPEPVALDEAVDQAVEGLRLQVKEAKAEVTHDKLPPVMADRVQLARVLQNLLSNALKFRGSEAPHIHVGARQEGQRWDVWVKDNGIGIDPKDQERVLQPFQRVHSTDEYPGTGLGLSICKKIAEMHGGRLWIVSEVGRGTEVHFTLPAVEA